MARPTEQDVAAFLSLKKSLVRVMEWTDRPSLKTPQWRAFESRCYLGSSISDEANFRAHYRPKGLKVRGASIIELPEAFYVSIWIREHRVFAIDTLKGQVHTNRIVSGMPFSGMKIDATTHMHIWTSAADGYAEPIEPPLVELEEIMTVFCQRVNLWLNGDIKHPMYGKSMSFLE
ncbi:hypothetical protein [Massilia sp. CCM 8734]|uniref:hypothetical protein n=1 Tax=Massilia sp. CCM 8734 TaxID=2609283 RepID=UPI0014249554|nr:hypothetical protein [Massilia sp. CCM 8734]NHZ98859.1 hypothetical protein [Massilia sp. CCM 8734]